jgi:uncharacterized membrane protein YqjE
MMNLRTRNGGWGALSRIFGTTVSILKNRTELAALEVKEEKSRLISAGVWGAVFIFSSLLALIAIMCTALFLFWEQRLSVAIGVLAFCLIGTLIAFLVVKRRLKAPKPFAETIAQFKKDRSWLQG